METQPPALIVSHGQPSDPAGAEAELALVAASVARLLPGREVASATLAAPGALDGALARHGPGGLLFPMFMAGGWFTRVHLPGRLKAAAASGWQVLEPMGCDKGLHDLAVQVALEAGGATSVVLAAHGSGQSAVPAAIAQHVAGMITARLGLPCDAAFIDQTPRLDAVSGHGEGAVCLPFFAASGGHVSIDIPQALAKAGFAGRTLPALGLDPRIPALIASAVMAQRPVCAGACDFAAR